MDKNQHPRQVYLYRHAASFLAYQIYHAPSSLPPHLNSPLGIGMNDDFDLNLLQFFNTLYALRNVTLTAEHLNITQPAASQRLVRLRNQMKDPLFTRVPGGVRPTAAADQLAPFISHALETIRRGIAEHQSFDPKTSHRTYRFHMSDMAEASFLPIILKGIEKKAPFIRMECSTYDPLNIPSLLHDGHIDFALGSLPMLTEVEQEIIFSDSYVLVSKKRADAINSSPIQEEEIRQLNFVSAKSNTPPHAWLVQNGLENRIKQRTSSTLSMLKLIETFPLHGLIASSIAHKIIDPNKLIIRDICLPQSPFNVSIYWSQRYAHLSYHRWMKNNITNIIKSEFQNPKI